MLQLFDSSSLRLYARNTRFDMNLFVFDAVNNRKGKGFERVEQIFCVTN